MKSQLSTKSLKALRNALPFGGVNAIAREAGLTQSLVSKVLNGHARNAKVIDLAIKLAEEEKLKKNNIETKIAEL